jgi:dTDP-glucose 4,6-dehydratase
MILVTGGAGFIGSAFVLQWIQEEKSPVITLDKLTYAGNLTNLESVIDNPLHTFVLGDICNRELLQKLLQAYKPIGIVNCAAESHVDRSIHEPSPFISTNIVGTSILLEETYQYWKTLPSAKQAVFRFLHLSTDEVYGSLPPESPPSTESSVYAPNSPYAASKAASDHLVRAYHKTYGLPTLITHASNNFGPRQFPEKLIPLTILHALEDKSIPIYGDGLQIRDWIYVEDHCNALRRLLKGAPAGEVYNIATGKEQTNLSLVKALCIHLDLLKPRSSGATYLDLIHHTKDRPGHDRRYAIDTSKMQNEFDWHPIHSFEWNLELTIQWYLDHPDWTEKVISGEYQNWKKLHYKEENLC